MSSFENFVQCRVVTPFTAAATEIGLFAADEPHRLPAEGGGVLVLTDSPYRPSALEVIRYGRRTGLALYDVSRAQEGTTARDWTGVAFCYQALTAGELAQLLGQKADLSALDGLREEAETALGGKVDKVAGKSLSTNDYTTAEKNKLANANLTALVGLTGAADRLPYFTGAGALSLATLTAAARTLLAASNVAGQQSALGLFADASGVMTNASGALTNFVSLFLRSADAAAGRTQLGLGTAATATLAQSLIDTALGRVLRVGDHGIGLSAQAPQAVSNIDDLSEWSAGIRRFGSSTTGSVPGNGFGVLFRIGGGVGSTNQEWLNDLAFDTSGKIFHRRKTNTFPWEPWRELLHTGNQLAIGTTAESARTALGLGTAATAPLQASALDTTPGAAVRVGGFGWGSIQSLPVPGNADGFSIPNGAYNVTPATTGALPKTNGYLLHLGRVSAVGLQQAFQLFSEDTSERAYLRWGILGAMGTAKELYHTGNASSLPITNSLSPATDNTVTLGEASKRWSTAHLGTAPIVTSDRDAKQDILPIDDAVLDAWETLGYMQYRLKDAVATKGEAARTHAGLIAQDIREAFEAAGLNPFKYGVLCYDEWEQELLEHPAEYEWNTVPAVLDDEGNEVEPERQEQGELIKEAWTEVVREAGHRYSVRYEEAFALECALQRRTTQRLEQRLAALEAA